MNWTSFIYFYDCCLLLYEKVWLKIDSETNTVEIICFCFAKSSCFHPIISLYGCLKIRNFLFLCSTPCFNISWSYLFLTFSVKTCYEVSLISWKKWIWNDSLNLLKFVIWFQKQIACFVEYKNDKERKMAKGKSWVERIKKQIAIKLENLRGRMTPV